MSDPHKYNTVGDDENVAQKHQVFFILCKKACPLSFTERLVWSVLVKAERMAGKGTMQSKLCAWTGLSPKTVRKALGEKSQLRKSGLVVRDHYRCWRASEPPESTSSWFTTRKSKGQHWADRLAYWPVKLGGPEHDHVFQNVFFSLLLRLKGDDDAVKHECHESLATLLGCDYRRVKTALKRLKENEVVEVIETRKNRYGKVVRFDVRFRHPSERTPEDTPVKLEDLQSPAKRPANPSPHLTEWHLRQREQQQRFTRIRSIRAMMKERMLKLGYEEWVVQKIVWTIDKIPTDDMARVFHALIKQHGHSAQSVLDEAERYVQWLVRQQKAEARELARLEVLSDAVCI